MNNLSISLSRDAQKFVMNLDAKQSKQVSNRIFKLQNDPSPQDCRHLSGYANCFRIDSGEYRIIYTVEQSILKIIVVAKRNDDQAYKELARKR
jgi:mRNA interferase RelE/StbE